MKVRDIIRFLEQDGWYLLTLPGHMNDDLAPGTLNSVLKQAGLKQMNYVVVYEKSATGWSAYVPDLPGVITTASTKEDAQRLIREAIEFHLEGLGEDNEPIPEPSASAEVVTVSS
jgi:predicted RNase H-like HicB family nuclease